MATLDERPGLHAKIHSPGRKGSYLRLTAPLYLSDRSNHTFTG